MSDDLLGGMSLLDLFRTEVATHVATLSSGLLALERAPGSLESLMRAAHSIKGAARIVSIEPAVKIAHALEECFVAAQRGEIAIDADDVDLLLRGTDHLAAIGIAAEPDLAAWGTTHGGEISALLDELRALAGRPSTPAVAPRPGARPARVTSGDPPWTIFDAMREAVRLATTTIDGLMAGLATDEAPVQRFERMLGAVQEMGAAMRPVGLEPAVTLTAAMEATLLAAQERRRFLPGAAESFAAANRALAAIARLKDVDVDAFSVREGPALRTLAGKLDDSLRYPEVRSTVPAPPPSTPAQRAPTTTSASAVATPAPAGAREIAEAERFVRVATASINKLLGLAGESVVEAQRIGSFMLALEKLRAHEASVVDLLDRALASIRHLDGIAPSLPAGIEEARARVMEIRSALGAQRGELEAFARRADDVSSRLYREAVSTRMRPFSDGVQGFPRLVRDLGRRLGRQVDLIIEGENVRVDRDVLDRIESPLNHMLRNAVDHGIEEPEERRAAGKPERGTIRLEARHTAGALSLVVTDDGRGVDTPKIRRRVAERGLLSAQAAEALSEQEAVEYIFVPGFSTADEVTDVSGRGVGLDVVRTTVQELGGSCRTVTELGHGTTFLLQLPLTLSVTRAVVVEIAGEPYAFPLLRIDRLVRLPVSEIRVLENRQYFHLDGRNVGLVRGRQVFELGGSDDAGADELDVVVVSDRASRCGIVVDGFLGEQDLVVQPLDPRLGRVADISAAAITPNGRPLLIVDVEDMVRSVARLLKAGLTPLLGEKASERKRGPKRVLVVDDSITVREVHRQLLGARGFEVVVAEDGLVAWQAAREGGFDLIVTDVDMPRMNGIELVRSIKQDPALRATPVMIVSYKDSVDDKNRGLEAGANFYVTKSDFHDETFLQAVIDLAGDPLGPLP